MTIALPSLATACNQSGVSDRSAAAVATSVLHNVGIVSPINLSQVTDRSKIIKKHRKARNKLQQNTILELA